MKTLNVIALAFGVFIIGMFVGDVVGEYTELYYNYKISDGGIMSRDGRHIWKKETDFKYPYPWRETYWHYCYFTKSVGGSTYVDSTLLIEMTIDEYHRIWWALEWEDDDDLKSKEYIYTFHDGHIVKVVDGKRMD